MSIDSSLKTKPSGLNQHRNVLTRAERITRLTEEEKFTDGEDSPIGLVKVANRQIVTKKPKKKEAEEGAEGEGAAAPAEGTPAAGGDAKK